MTPQQNDVIEVSEESSLRDVDGEKSSSTNKERLVHISLSISLFHYNFRSPAVKSYDTPVKSQKRRRIDADPIEIEILKQLKESRLSRSDYDTSNDKEFSFGRMVLLTLKRFHPQQKAQAKIKIQQLLYEIEFPISLGDIGLLILFTFLVITGPM